MKGRNVPVKSGRIRPGFHWLRVLRIVVAFAFLLLFLAIFLDFRKLVSPWVMEAAAKTQIVPAWQSVLAGAGWSALALFLLFVAGTFIFGRVYCSFLCPLGIFQDVVSWVARLFKKGKRKAYKYTRPVKGIRALMLAGVIGTTLAGVGGLFWLRLDPYSQFGRFVAFFGKPAVMEANNALISSINEGSRESWMYAVVPDWPFFLGGALVPILILMLGIIIFAAWRGRLYCNTICPVGAVLGLISRYSLLKVSIDQSACIKCAHCMKSCKSECIDLKTSSIDYSRCVNCFDCVSVCEGRGIRYRFAWNANGGGDASPPVKKTASPMSDAPSQPEQAARENTVMQMLPSTGRRAFIGSTLAGLTATLMSCAEKKTRGAVKSPQNPKAISPPGSKSIDRFLSACTGCQLCVVACPGDCLKPSYMEYGAGGIFKPRMSYEKGFCQFECTTCSQVCPKGAIDVLCAEAKVVTQFGRANLDLDRCIAANNKTDCGACAEHCPKGALEMVRLKQPVLTRSKCVSCLQCKEVCPKGAITYTDGRRKHPIFDYSKCIGCGSCLEVCEGDALDMEISTYDVRVPVLHVEYCIGCGGCEYICPPKTIVVNAVPVHGHAKTFVPEQVVNPNEGMDFPF